MIPTEIKFKGKAYQILKELYMQEGIQGQDTVCWKVRSLETKKQFLLKLSCINLSHKYSEIDFYQTMREKQIEGVPILVNFEDSKIHKKVDTTSQWLPADASMERCT